MLEGKPPPAGSGRAAVGYSYPRDLARFVRERWNDGSEPPGGVDPLPDAEALEGFFAASYQASMLREEERPVLFRAILAEPEFFDPAGRPPRACSGSRSPARSPSARGRSGVSRRPQTRSGRSLGYGRTGREPCAYGAWSTRAPGG
jgi:hypothetical protein